ncbi:MAG TPA: IPT/TIG domain-containing protein [Polyangiaceae bacterium]|jgi:hypothetical protein
MSKQKLAIVSITPRQGATTGGFTVRVEGRGFGAGLRVKLGENAVIDLKLIDAHSLEFVAPAASKAGYVDLELQDGEAHTQKNAFRYEAAPPPVIHSVVPSRGPTAGGIDVRILGENFVPWSRVTFQNRRPLSIILLDGNTLEIIPPPGAHGELVDITVTNPDGAETTAKRAFVYDKRFDAKT